MATSETKWTSGPWNAMRGESHPGGIEWFVMRPGEDIAICADVIDPKTEKPSEVNARLIAAAPDMYAALSALVSFPKFKPGIGDDVTEWYGNWNAALDSARSALARARGEEV